MKHIPIINPDNYTSIMFFTGAGMSAESGIPTYRGAGGIWHQYRWEEFACQRAFNRDPEKVLDFHEVRRAKVLQCRPHSGHDIIAGVQKKHSNTWIVTQNIDGMHQRAGAGNVVELHGSLWRMRCENHGITEDHGEEFKTRKCPVCENWLRPDITWFEDMLDMKVMEKATSLITNAKLFISIGTSGVVYPAAAYPRLAHDSGAYTICINTELPGDDSIFDIVVPGRASEILIKMFSSQWVE